MSTILNNTMSTSSSFHSAGETWRRLHDEREKIIAALLKDSKTDHLPHNSMSWRINSGARWHREMLQARLRKVDDALDRLLSGSYGNCCKCGRWIEDTKLNFDPAIAFCIDCWERQKLMN
jgi:RNA polymerase-binding transcription factor DksA